MKIVCTLGPRSSDLVTLRGLVAAGMDVARLNFSHGSYQQHAERIALVRQVSAEAGRPIALLQDLQGPKLRVETPGGAPVELREGQPCVLTTLPAAALADPSAPARVTVSYAAFCGDVKPGDGILLDDGNLKLVVEQVAAPEVFCRVVHGGLLTHKKGLNLPGCALSIDVITGKDRADLAFGLAQGVDFIAMSFVQRADDIRQLKRLITEAGHDTPVVAKIEKPQAVDDLDNILKVTDAIMVARGDLGVEMATEELPPLQKHIIAACNRVGVPVITATQMLESMVKNPRPTRAEATDVANAVYDGTDAVMLSAETASGDHPITVVETMVRIVVLAEQSAPAREERRRRVADKTYSPPEAIAYSACHASRLVAARAIVSLSIHGNIPRAASRYRPDALIVAVSTLPTTVRRCCLLWGVRGFLIDDFYGHLDEATQRLKSLLLAARILSPGDTFVLTAGIPFAHKVPTNALAIDTA